MHMAECELLAWLRSHREPAQLLFVPSYEINEVRSIKNILVSLTGTNKSGISEPAWVESRNDHTPQTERPLGA